MFEGTEPFDRQVVLSGLLRACPLIFDLTAGHTEVVYSEACLEVAVVWFLTTGETCR